MTWTLEQSSSDLHQRRFLLTTPSGVAAWLTDAEADALEPLLPILNAGVKVPEGGRLVDAAEVGTMSRPLSEKDFTEAPVHLSNEAAHAWSDGWNSAIEAQANASVGELTAELMARLGLEVPRNVLDLSDAHMIGFAISSAADARLADDDR